MLCTQALFELGVSSPAALIAELEAKDPFGVWNLTRVGDFRCPRRRRFAMHDHRNASRHARFKRGDGLLFYQHLRKAGGSSFCALVRDNIGKQATPNYHCMIDNAGRLSTPPWNDSETLLTLTTNSGYRVIVNEWDVFPSGAEGMVEMENVLYASTFRDPAARWYSQYRFEHLEHRDQASKRSSGVRTFSDWYNGWVTLLGINYYVKTFLRTPLDYSGSPRFADFHWAYLQRKHAHICWPEFLAVLRLLQRFDLLLVQEWLKDTGSEVAHTLGWSVPPRVVLPDPRVSQRASATEEETKFMQRIREENWMDTLLFQWVKRIVAERTVCTVAVRHSMAT